MAGTRASSTCWLAWRLAIFGRGLGDAGLQGGDDLVEILGQAAGDRPLELRAHRVAGEALEPGAAGRGAARSGRAPTIGDVLGDVERRVGPAQRVLGGLGFGRAQRRAVRGGGAGLGGRGEADDGAAGDQRGLFGAHRHGQRGGDLDGVVAVHALGGPAIGGEALELVVRGGQAGVAVDGDANCRPTAR